MALKPWKLSYSSRRKKRDIWTYDRLNSEILCCKIKTVDFLTEKGILKSEQRCPVCGHLMSRCSSSKFSEGLRFRCQRRHFDPTSKSFRRHDKEVSVRRGSWFKGFNLTLSESLKAIYFWAIGLPIKTLRRELPITWETAVEIYSFIREICACVAVEHAEPLGGFDSDGQPIVVEIDESKVCSVIKSIY